MIIEIPRLCRGMVIVGGGVRSLRQRTEGRGQMSEAGGAKAADSRVLAVVAEGRGKGSRAFRRVRTPFVFM